MQATEPNTTQVYLREFPSADESLVSLRCEELPEKSGSLWTLQFHNITENILTHEAINAGFKPALDQVEREWREEWRGSHGRAAGNAGNEKPRGNGSGALIITGHGKYFCGGIDFARAIKDPNFFSVTLNPLLTRLLTFPIPVIAAINGHSFTAGLMISLACDYRLMCDGSMRSAWSCMTEVHMGAPWPDSFVAITNAKVASAHALRTLALDGARISPKEALKLGIVDRLVPTESSNEVELAVLSAARELANQVAGNARAGAWGLIKKHIYRDALEKIATDYRLVMASDDDAAHAKL